MLDASTAQYMLTTVDGCLTYVRGPARHHRPGAVTHPHGGDDHRADLEQPFREAREAIHRRLHDRGTRH